MIRFTFIIFLVLTSCSEKQNEKFNSDVRIVESLTPMFKDSFWTVSEEPALSIGLEDGSSDYQFYRSFSAKKLTNGNFVVTNSGTSEIRWYEGDGSFIKSAGREGRGPGDFAKFSSMRIHKYTDSLLIVTDGRNDRIHLYDTSGEYIEAKNLPKIDGTSFPNLTNVFSNNDFLVWSNVGSGALQGNPGTLIKLKFGLHRISKDWNYESLIVERNSRVRYVNQVGETTDYPYIPFSPPPSYATGTENNVFFTPGDEPKIELIDSSGVILNAFIWNSPRKKVDDVWERYKEESLNTLSGNREKQYRHFYSEPLPLPKFVPAISELKTDTQGNIWAKRFTLPWETNKTWDVLNTEGLWLGTLSTPEGMSVTEIGKDYILGYTYINGFQQIVMHNLNKNYETE